MRNRLLDSGNCASAVIHGPVRNRSGERLGRIEDLVLDLESGRIEYALLGLDCDTAVVGRRLVSVPWSALHKDGDGPAFVLEVSLQTLLAISVSAPA
ncbi:MAG TPA: PRC-barrel domain-containing protein [Gammaproteobacteria bacterium]|nr:PRC-barrel domain-containing protein [Gammaproteobacteria bacterium]